MTNNFQKDQQNVVTKFGSLITILESFISKIEVENIDNQTVTNEIRKIEPIISNFSSKMGEINDFYRKNNYQGYISHSAPEIANLTKFLATQTLPSKRREISNFIEYIKNSINHIKEVMLSTAQIISLELDINLKANNPFSAYCFIKTLFNSPTDKIIIIDPYIDYSIFYRYLMEIKNSTFIEIISDKKNLKGERLIRFQEVENLFKIEYPNYSLKLVENLHDRYLINATSGYNLGGSIKDAAKKSDFSIIRISEEKRLELIKNYT